MDDSTRWVFNSSSSLLLFLFFFFFPSPLPFLRRKKGERKRGRLEDFVTEIGGRLDLGLWYAFRRDFFETEQVLLVSRDWSFSLRNDDSRKVWLASLWFVSRSIFHLFKLDWLVSSFEYISSYVQSIGGVRSKRWKFEKTKWGKG